MPFHKSLIPNYASLLDSCLSVFSRTKPKDTCHYTESLLKLKQVHAGTIVLGLDRNFFIHSRLVACYSSFAQMEQACYLFSLDRQSSFLYNCLMRAYASLELFHDSLCFFRRMILSKKHVDCHTLPVVLKSCAALSDLRLGKQLHCAALNYGFALDLANSNALVTMYSKCGDIVAARNLFDEMRVRVLRSWTAMMDGYGMHGQFGKVFDLFERMLEMGERPDGVAFTVVLSACSHGGFAEKGKEYFGMMEPRFDVAPGLEHYTCVVDMLGRVGRVEEAYEFVMGMELEPDDALWGALLGACKIHGKAEIADSVAEQRWKEGRKSS